MFGKEREEGRVEGNVYECLRNVLIFCIFQSFSLPSPLLSFHLSPFKHMVKFSILSCFKDFG